jgi:hypothetical protein
MKSIQFHLWVIVSLFVISSCKNEEKKSVSSQTEIKTADTIDPIADTLNYTTIQWLDSIQKFGKVTDGEKVQISFHFKNTGNKPLIISNVTAGCGCTIPEKPEAPIAPGQEGRIKAEFNSEGRVGQVTKNLTVTCNTAIQNYTLLFEGEVIAKKQSQ